MRISPDNILVREAVYSAYKGKCFFTGRPVPYEEMQIDHLVAVNRGGKDSLDNYVLTFRDLNIGKRDKCDERVFRMRWVVEQIFAPRMKKYIKRSLRKKVSKRKKIQNVQDTPYKEGKNQNSCGRQLKPRGLRVVYHLDLFWAEDKKVEVLTSSKLVDKHNVFFLLPTLESGADSAHESESSYVSDVWLTKKYINQVKSLWLHARARYFKMVSKVVPYDNDGQDSYGIIYFTKEYMDLLSWQKMTYEKMCELSGLENETEYERLISNIDIEVEISLK